MNEENTDYLVGKYPKLYRRKNLPLSESSMAIGFDCGDGWVGILDALSANLEFLNDQFGDAILVEAVQVKEKFGTLRFYYTPTVTVFEKDPRVDGVLRIVRDLVNLAESESNYTCMLCGNTPAEICTSETGIWLTNVCKKCQETNPKNYSPVKVGGTCDD